MRKLLIICFISILSVIFAVPAFAQLSADFGGESFPDVPENSEHFAAIQSFKDQGVIQGYPDGTFRPDQKAIRAEALKIILLSSDIEINRLFSEEEIFPDVNTDDWFYSYVKTAKEAAIVEGYEDGTFKPGRVLNLAETLKIILLTNNIQIESVPINSKVYPDVSSDLWFAPYAEYARDKNLIEAKADGLMHPELPITRADLVEIMYRLNVVEQNNGAPFDISTNWPTQQFLEQGFETKAPFDWQVIENQDSIVLWLQDNINHQSSYEVPFPFSASVTIHLDHNNDGLDQIAYEENLDMVYKSDFGSYQKNSLTIAGSPALNFNVNHTQNDYFVFVSDNKVLQIYTSYGWSDATPQLEAEIDSILKSVKSLVPIIQTPEEFLSSIRELLLIEGEGQNILNQFSDEFITETDTIGIGTGPVDYYYSEQYNVTLKFERNSNTMLDMQNGNTIAF